MLELYFIKHCYFIKVKGNDINILLFIFNINIYNPTALVVQINYIHAIIENKLVKFCNNDIAKRNKIKNASRKE